MKLLSTVVVIALASSLLSCSSPEHFSANNAVAAAHPLASQAAIEMYDQGGNAADAAVAAAFTLAVVEPSMSGIGGRLQAIIHNPSTGVSGIDASTQVPEKFDNASQDNDGYKTIGIPGVVAGLTKLHEEYGSLPLSVVMQPAIRLAEEGFSLLPGEAFRQSMAKEAISAFDGSSKWFLKADRSSYQAYDTLKQPALSSVLRSIAERGKDGFYKGEVAQQIVQDMQQNGGYLTLNDLANYEALESQIVSGTYKNLDIHSLYLPSYGAITVNLLQILDHFDLDLSDPFTDLFVSAQAISKAYAKRSIQKDSLSSILSAELAEAQAQEIKRESAFKNAVKAGDPLAWSAAQGHTTHLTTADRDGLIVSLTQTIGPNMGSKVATSSLGFLYAVTMGGYLGDYQPGDRANSHISPTLVLKNGTPDLALGAAGGSRIVTAIAQTIKNHYDLNLTLAEAVARGRVYPEEEELLIEAHQGIVLDSIVLQRLDSMGLPYTLQERPGYHGRINAIKFDTVSRSYIGVSDPDWEGIALYDN
jgi:gamma-glutamyltranspeptidase / glutathione hydrolase